MADTKFLDYAGLAYFKEKLDTEYDDKYATPGDIPVADGETIIDNNGTWSAKLPEGGAIVAGDDGLELDLNEVAGTTLEVTNNSTNLDVVVDGVTIKKSTADPNTGKTKLYVDLSEIIDDDTIKNENGKLTVDSSALDIPEYELPAATANTRGGITVGHGLEITSGTDDKLKVKAANDSITVSAEGIKVTNGKYAPLVDGTIPSSYLPSYVDDVIEGYFVPGDAEAVPPTEDTFYLHRTGSGTEQDPYVYTDPVTTPDISKIYVDLESTDTFRWSGSVWVNISGAAIDVISEPEIDALFPVNP